jgi:hypothetical protein
MLGKNTNYLMAFLAVARGRSFTPAARQIISRHWHDPNDPKLRHRRDQN